MNKNFNFIKACLYGLIIYTSFLIICGFLAPILAAYKQFYFADIIYLLMHKSCTQDALRCFWILGYPMAICARCFGAYCGVIISILFWLKENNFNKKIYFALMLMAFGEILLEFLKIYKGNNYIRYFAGAALGGFIITSLYYLFEYKRKRGNVCLEKL